MKIVTKCIIDLKTMEVVSETSYEYFGSIAMCKGGGGTSGVVDYPDYMKAAHEDWLAKDGIDAIASSVTEVMSSALGNSPWTSQTPYDPDSDLASSEAAISAFAALLSGISDLADWAGFYSQVALSVGSPSTVVVADVTVADQTVADETVTSITNPTPVEPIEVTDLVISNIPDTDEIEGITEAIIAADVDAFADQMDDEITSKVLPRFRRGMQDINAVVSSAFPIGQAIIEAFRDRDIAKHSSALRISAAVKNADIETENERLHLEVRKINIGKDLEVGRSNLSTHISVATKNADILLDGERLLLETKKTNIGKDVEISRANLGKDVEISRANIGKDVEIGKANLAKDVQIGEITVRTDAEYERMYLEGSSQILKLMLQRVAFEEGYMKTVVESNRIRIVAKKEQADTVMAIDEKDATWDLEVFQYGGNLLASISGGTGSSAKTPSTAQSMIGGAMSGAAAGAMIGGPWGALIGGVIGGASGLLGGK